MTRDLGPLVVATPGEPQLWDDSERYWGTLQEATAELPAPLAALSLPALRWNAAELTRRAGGLPVRIASKSVRSRELLHAVLALPGFRGVLAYTLPEALWLADTITDVVVAYPTADRAALRELSRDPLCAARVTVMIDDVAHIELIDAAVGPAAPHRIRVCIDLDASWQSRVLGHVGVRRSPVRTPEAARALAEAVARSRSCQLVGLMSYEAQIAGVADQPKGRRVTGALLRRVQARSAAELHERRAAAVAAVNAITPLEFVNGGGTGSLERTAAEPSVTELAAGSGLFGPHLFDHYKAFTPAPALGFALDVVRSPTPDRVTVLGGGWIASGPPGTDRLPRPVWPPGLTFEPREAAGEVQTPLRGHAAHRLQIGDRVWMRHAKAGELLEHVAEVIPVDGQGRVGAPLQSYRGEGRCFL